MGLKKRVLNVSVCISYSYSVVDSRDANYYLLLQGYWKSVAEGGNFGFGFLEESIDTHNYEQM